MANALLKEVFATISIPQVNGFLGESQVEIDEGCGCFDEKSMQRLQRSGDCSESNERVPAELKHAAQKSRGGRGEKVLIAINKKKAFGQKCRQRWQRSSDGRKVTRGWRRLNRRRRSLQTAHMVVGNERC